MSHLPGLGPDGPETVASPLPSARASAKPSSGQKPIRTSQAGDPLSAPNAMSLLTRVSVIRDPLHGDISVTKLERTIIDTPVFQRLKHIDQLAMVEPVYPGAVHTRFLHSLGVLHVCAEMIIACNNSARSFRRLANAADPIPVRIGPYAEVLARLVALMHDMAHIPFGHVLEREAQVIPEDQDEWKDPWRVGQVFGRESGFSTAFVTAVREHFGDSSAPEAERLQPSEAEKAAFAILEEVKSVLTAERKEGHDTVQLLRYPFVYDLVSNTICADLIDYIQRDMFFCGLSERIGTRFMRQLGVIPTEFDPALAGTRDFSLRPYRVGEQVDSAQPTHQTEGKSRAARLALLLYSYNERHAFSTKENVLGEAIDLVRRRKQLAEKVYFHKTKLIATAMLAAAAQASGLKSAEPVWDKSDREVLQELARASPDATVARRRGARLAQKLMDRKLFKRLYRCSYHAPSDDHVSKLLWDPESGAYERYVSPAARMALIEKLEKVIALMLGDTDKALGTVAISCPNRKMQLKGFEMMVLPTPDTTRLGPLQATVRPVVRKEIEVIQEGHLELWRLEVLVDAAVVDLSSPLAKVLAAAVQEAIGLPNEVPEFAKVLPIDLVTTIKKAELDSVLRATAATDKVTHVQYEELMGTVSASSSDKTFEQFIHGRLREWKHLPDDAARQ